MSDVLKDTPCTMMVRGCFYGKKGVRIGFAAMVEELVNGGGVWKGNWPKMLVEMIVTQLHSQGELLGYMVLLIVSGAFLSVIAKAFRGRQISDMGFYMIYLLLFLMMRTT